MKALRATLQTFAVLLGGWAALALIGMVAGVLPISAPAPQDAGAAADSGIDEEQSAAADAGPADVPSAPDAGSGAATDLAQGAPPPDPAPTPTEPAPTPPEPAAPPPLVRERWIVCPEPALSPSLAALDLVGDARSEVVVGCGTAWEVFAFDPESLAPTRIARIEGPPTAGEVAAAFGAAIAADIDGDGARDLVLPFARFGAGNATRGGGLYVVPRDRFGGFDPPRPLAPIAAVSVAAGMLDADGQPDLAVVHLANPFARLPSEVWIFSGGASPSRRAALRTGTGAQSVGIADLNRDDHADVIVAAADDGRVDVFFGDGAGAFPQRVTLSVPNPVAIAVGDVDGDRAADAVVEGEGTFLLRAQREGALEATQIDAAPSALRGIEAIDVDGDTALEIVGWDHPRLVAIDLAGDRAEVRTWMELAGSELGPRRHTLADLDGRGEPEIVVLGVSTEAGARTIELVIVPGTDRGAVWTGTRRPIPEAPLALRVPLPDPDRP
jgi:hypothetical protein